VKPNWGVVCDIGILKRKITHVGIFNLFKNINFWKVFSSMGFELSW
jgi:hypothetical protein